jgi:hypothetical protein
MGRNGEILATFIFFPGGARVKKVNAKTPWGDMWMSFDEDETPEAPNATEPKK